MLQALDVPSGTIVVVQNVWFLDPKFQEYLEQTRVPLQLQYETVMIKTYDLGRHLQGIIFREDWF